jgi:hypothetical protein
MAGAPPDCSTVRLRHRHVSSSNPALPSRTSLGPSRHGEYVGALAIVEHLTAGEESTGDAPPLFCVLGPQGGPDPVNS